MTPRDSRAIKLGVAVLALALLLARGVPAAVRGLEAMKTRSRETSAAAARAREIMAAAPTLRDSLTQSLAAVVALAPALVDGHTSAESGSNLAALVSLAAGRHALRVVRLDPLPDSLSRVFGRVGVHAELEGDARGLEAFLRALRVGSPVLAIPSLAVLAPGPAGAEGAEVLRIEATIAGRYLPRGDR